MRVVLELLRIIIIIAVLSTILGYIPHFIYSELGINTDRYGWASMIGVFILIFVLYRNRLQFSGWYKGKGREKLPKRVSRILILGAIVLLLAPLMLHFLLS
ncbi:hypothetical protein [Desulfuribacillus alkaliarsenatis]|uniref:Uncharacterized protein n=1 Tax=Desulfuribacillus alkaliarsenatis TaxID=766136 RepID=A0A1E5G2L3_9FIRM|nr:hypothetical protein [Desulfuribacillus alkaliarsenatis]OEF97229.1 hypothetical protein BHF68_14800 [Desulfuribacillus alkaliarsenatis]